MKAGRYLVFFIGMFLVWQESIAQSDFWKTIGSHGMASLSAGRKDLKKDTLTAFVFLSPECPLSKKMLPELKKLASSGSCQFVAVFPGRSYNEKEIRAFISEYAIPFACITDPVMSLTRTLQAKVTPQVVLVNAGGRVAYTGLIDDKIISLGKQRSRATSHYLADAISSQASGKEPAVRKTEPVGCFINEY